MIRVEIDFRMNEAQADGSERYAHTAIGYVHTTSEKDLIILCRECTNIQCSISIIAYRVLGE